MNENKLTTCAGLRRSGSTWLFNVVRIILNKKFNSVKSIFASNNKDITDQDLIKIHHFNESIANKSKLIFITIRDFREVVASCIRRNAANESNSQITNDSGYVIDFENLNDIKDFLNREKTNFELWKSRANLIIPFHYMQTNKAKTIRTIANEIKIEINEQEILEEVESLKVPEKLCDPTTFLWANHITNGNIGSYDEITIEIKQFIEETYADYIIPNLPNYIRNSKVF